LPDTSRNNNFAIAGMMVVGDDANLAEEAAKKLRVNNMQVAMMRIELGWVGFVCCTILELHTVNDIFTQ
jgi:hypothetical protein